MKRINICAVITAASIDKAIQDINEAKKLTDWIEIRADYIQQLSDKDITALSTASSGTKCIFTLRDIKYGGKFEQGDLARLNLFSHALESGFTYYDVDFEAYDEYQPLLELNSAKIILSYHNFHETPDMEILAQIYESMSIMNPSVVKMATMVNDENDLRILTNLLLKYPEQKKIIVGMGPIGAISRITFPLMGSLLTFASLKDQASASGQIDILQMQNIYKTIFNSLN